LRFCTNYTVYHVVVQARGVENWLFICPLQWEFYKICLFFSLLKVEGKTSSFSIETLLVHRRISKPTYDDQARCQCKKGRDLPISHKIIHEVGSTFRGLVSSCFYYYYFFLHGVAGFLIKVTIPKCNVLSMLKGKV
jgi:hypothetical protein